MIRRPPRSTRVRSSAASDVYKRQDQSSERSDAGSWILQKVITVVKGKVVVAGAVGKWESLLRFPRAFLARLFHSFWPAARRSFFSFLSRFFAHRFAAHFDSMSVVH